MTSESHHRIGPYRIEHPLGSGGMGTVYRAFDERLERHVALKHIRPERARNSKTRRRFLREARVTARLNHPVLVQVHDILEVEGDLWIVMELVVGSTLAERLEAGPLPLAVALEMALEITSGLTAIHDAGILHRDLKSENLIVTPSSHIRILDFGLAKVTDQDPSLSSQDELLGTPRAMSPEQAQGLDLSPASDLFALGTLLYEMVSGRSPFLGPGPLETVAKVCHELQEPLIDLVPDLPRELSLLVDRLLAKDPLERPQSSEEVTTVLESLVRPSRSRAPHHDPRAAEPPQNQSPAVGEGFRRRGERRRVTVLCCELIGNTKAPDFDASDSVDPEALYEILPQFQNLVSELIDRYGGYLGEFQGHRLVVCFGYPQAREDPADRAVWTALEMIERCREIATATDEPGGWVARIGIHSGPAVVLNRPGQDERLVLGKTLDETNAIQEHAGLGHVVVSPETCRLLVGSFDFELLAVSHPDPSTGIDELLRVRGAAHDFDPVTDRQSLAPLVGRAPEIALLTDRFELAREGVGQVVLLTGDAGMGKTRLLRALRQRLAPEGPLWLIAQGSSFARHWPLFPMLAPILDLLGLDHQEPPASRHRRLIESLEGYGLPVAETEPLLWRWIDGAPRTTHPLESRDLRALVSLLLELILEVVEQRGEARGGTVLVFEDVHWMDPSTLQLADLITGQGTTSPLLIVLTRRPDPPIPWNNASQRTDLHLPPLEPTQIEAMISHALSPDRATEVQERIVRHAAGVPRYAHELALGLTRGAGLQDEDGVPATLDGFLASQLDRLGTAKDLALVASILGEAFSEAELKTLADEDTETFEHEFGRLEESRTLERTDLEPGSWRFRNPLVRQAARGFLLEEDRRYLEHRTLGPTAETLAGP